MLQGRAAEGRRGSPVEAVGRAVRQDKAVEGSLGADRQEGGSSTEADSLLRYQSISRLINLRIAST